MTVPKAGNNKPVRISISSTSSSSSTSIPSTSMISVPSRTLLKTILKTFLKIIFKLWKWASSFVIVFFFAAWFYGGVLPYVIFVGAFLRSDESSPLLQHNQSHNNNYNDNNDDIVNNEINNEDAQESITTEASGTSSNRRQGKCFSICPFELPIVTPPKIWLRNRIVPKEMWHEFPDGLSYHITDYFLYQPDMPNDSRLFVESPARYSMQFEDVWIHTKDRVKIHGYLIKQNRLSNRNIPTLIFFHGNAGNIGHRLENVKLFYYNLNCNVLMVEYRGYGRSEGTPSEKGLYADAQAAFEYIDAREDLDSKKIILFGRSLGGAVAIDLAARCDFRDRVAALIIENTFTSIPAVAKELFQFAILRWIPHFFFKNRFESLQKIGSVACPTLFISGTNDELLPPAMMNELYSKCSASVKLLQRFPGSHNDTWTCKDYIVRIAEFIEEVVNTGPRKTSAMFQPYSDNIV